MAESTSACEGTSLAACAPPANTIVATAATSKARTRNPNTS